ncbi:glycoside hydrolase family 3 N-terminal domain-containing protein [Paramagnetospirillum magneticum]|uniref:beta-N-acetylhexosaminidase n=1 Tax=Paramagnetospirillum magneticum (strain ATCC 700264 / AMB-1) TaxID=342108 RepID=Q2W679_PARM1|nr:glycoside hydrolase family 3 N-terminal domain-containing protein [Paramagnetospirillum magneticum]BAE50646.1 Beta-glucosidase-related glycosidase [Paramagnetospirillum magneticum AMB-1]
MRERISIGMLWAGGILLPVLGFNLHNPYLTLVRGWALPLLVIVELAALAWIARRGRDRHLALLWCAALAATLAGEGKFQWDKRWVLAQSGAQAHDLGRHFVVGYRRYEDVEALAAKGLIGGIFVTRHNLAGRTADEFRREIAALQAVRRNNGLPPLLVATDQEGGIVSHLSPPLPPMPSLAELASLPLDQRVEAARLYGERQGLELARLGVTVNFAPVADIRREGPRNRLDFHSLIARRAISHDPEIVGQIATAYSTGLLRAGIVPTVKHFPGLGRVREDTHHFQASLAASEDDLEATDWRPFRQVLSDTPALLMVGHVRLAAIDPDRPASHSRAVIHGIIRKKWGFTGRVITDDLTMPPVYHGGLCIAVTEALDAGVDLLLISFDGQQIYRALACAMKAR